MAKERFKTLLLLSMVCISIFFTRHLWVKMPCELVPFFKEEEAVEANYLLGDMIKPHRYLLNFSDEAHTIYYNDNNNNLWTSTRPILKDILSSSGVKLSTISNEDFLTYNEKRSIVFYFPEEFNTYIISKSLNITKPNNIAKEISEIDSIYFYLGRGEPFFIFSQGDKHLKLYNIDVDLEGLREQVRKIEDRKDFTYYYPMRDTLDADNNLFISYEMTKSMPKIYVENEFNINDIDEIREMAERFFNKDIDYIGEIIEDSGSIIYLYNQQVLKVNPNGQIEYFNPLEESVVERNLYTSLNYAANFLSKNADIPQDMYLARIEKIKSDGNEGYRLSFRYRMREYPLILSSDSIKEFIQIDVFNEHIRSYKRFIRKDMNLIEENFDFNEKTLSSFDIINMNYNLLESEYIKKHNLKIDDINAVDLKQDILSSIDNINIAYIDLCTKDVEEELIGVWILDMEDELYAFDIYSGNLVLKK